MNGLLILKLFISVAGQNPLDPRAGPDPSGNPPLPSLLNIRILQNPPGRVNSGLAINKILLCFLFAKNNSFSRRAIFWSGMTLLFSFFPSRLIKHHIMALNIALCNVSGTAKIRSQVFRSQNTVRSCKKDILHQYHFYLQYSLIVKANRIELSF